MNKKLYKSLKDKKVSGVCGGFAKYLNMDVSIIRIAVVFLTLITFGVIFGSLYIACIIIMPYDPDELGFEKKDNNVINAVKKAKNMVM